MPEIRAGAINGWLRSTSCTAAAGGPQAAPQENILPRVFRTYTRTYDLSIINIRGGLAVQGVHEPVSRSRPWQSCPLELVAMRGEYAVTAEAGDLQTGDRMLPSRTLHLLAPAASPVRPSDARRWHHWCACLNGHRVIVAHSTCHNEDMTV